MQFKNEKDKELFFSLHPILILIYADLFLYAKTKHNIDLVVTATISTLEEDRALNRSSAAHREARAIDIRSEYEKSDAFIISDLVNYINSKEEYKKYHYMSFSNEKRLAYWHIGSGPHIHLALNSKYAIKL